MSKQKLVVFIIAIIGMIATFLPWYEVGSVGMIMGYQTFGWFSFVLFALAFLFGLRGKQKNDITGGLLYMISIFSLLAAFAVMWQMITIGLNKEGAQYDGAADPCALRGLSSSHCRNLFAVRGFFVQKQERIPLGYFLLV